MKSTSNQHFANIPAFVAELSEKLCEINSEAMVVLVGGSAFEFHFPAAHASLDADLCVNLFSRERDKKLSEVLSELGFASDRGRIYSHPDVYFTVDLVGTDVFVESQWMKDEIEEHSAPNGKRFFVLSATAMVFDRIAAWAAWKDADSLRKVEVALSASPEKVKAEKLKKFVSKESAILKKVSHELGKDSVLRRVLGLSK